MYSEIQELPLTHVPTNLLIIVDLNCDVPLDSLGCTVRNSTPDHDVDVKAESPSNPDPTNTDVITKINSQSNARRESENESILSYNVPCLKCMLNF